MDDLNSQEISNVGHTNVYRSDIRRIDAHLLSRLKKQANYICKDVINSRYIRMAFNKFDTGYAYRDEDDTIVGFCIWKTYIVPPMYKSSSTNSQEDTRYVYILLFCAKFPELKLGRMMLQDVEDYCIDHAISSIRLEPSHETTHTYYKKMGYTVHTTPNNRVEMFKNVQPIVLKRVTNRNKTRRAKTASVRNHTRKRTPVFRLNKDDM